jgi:hypothetical protein
MSVDIRHPLKKLIPILLKAKRIRTVMYLWTAAAVVVLCSLGHAQTAQELKAQLADLSVKFDAKVKSMSCKELVRATTVEGMRPIAEMMPITVLVGELNERCAKQKGAKELASALTAAFPDTPGASRLETLINKPQVETPKTIEGFRDVSNRTIAKADRLRSDYEQAQMWDHAGPSDPKAVALRSKIADEEKEFKATSAEFLSYNQWTAQNIDSLSINDRVRLSPLLNEVTVSMQAAADQASRYHALGY